MVIVPELRPWKLVRVIFGLIKPLALVCLTFVVMSLIGYAVGIEALYRPIPDGSATNPLTALCVIFISLALRIGRDEAKWHQLRLLACVCLALLLIHLVDVIFHLHLTHFITPFSSIVDADISHGKNNSMGLNSTLMLTSIGLSILAYSFNRLTLSQLFGFVALAFPSVSLIGYIYGLGHFHGQMSILTTMIGWLLGIATLGLTADHGAFKAFLSPYLAGRIARLQTVVGFLLPVILGFIIVKTLDSSEDTLFGLFVIAICWVVILMTNISAIYQELTDSKRRKGEVDLADAAIHDSLTNLKNRRYFFDSAEQEIIRAKNRGIQLGVMLIDLDHFKRINDTKGHEMGDKVLVKVSRCLESTVRNADIVCRYGGEEFAILLMDTTEAGLAKVAENICKNISKLYVEGWTDLYGSITASIGCTLNEGEFSIQQSLRVADAALYQAKREGRNQAIIA